MAVVVAEQAALGMIGIAAVATVAVVPTEHGMEIAKMGCLSYMQGAKQLSFRAPDLVVETMMAQGGG